MRRSDDLMVGDPDTKHRPGTPADVEAWRRKVEVLGEIRAKTEAQLERKGLPVPDAVRTKDKEPERPPGVSDKDWHAFLVNQLHRPADEKLEDRPPPIELSAPDKPSHFWDEAEVELSKLDPDYEKVDALIGKALQDDANRQGGGELRVPKIKIDRPRLASPQRPLEGSLSPSGTWPVVRDTILFVGGLAGVLYCVLFGAEASLLVLFAAMLALPAFVRWPDSQSD